jgi:hypothetical protein
VTTSTSVRQTTTVLRSDDDNPYLDEFTAVCGSGAVPIEQVPSVRNARTTLVGRYAWAVPSQGALDVLATLSPIVEIGAGSGYWAHLLAARGADIVCYDAAPPVTLTNRFGHHRAWFDIDEGGPDEVDGHSAATLLLCWPPFRSTFARECLERYQGETFAYIGEPVNGCTADAGFHEHLERHWVQVEAVRIPTWPGFSDRLVVHRRR